MPIGGAEYSPINSLTEEYFLQQTGKSSPTICFMRLPRFFEALAIEERVPCARGAEGTLSSSPTKGWELSSQSANSLLVQVGAGVEYGFLNCPKRFDQARIAILAWD